MVCSSIQNDVATDFRYSSPLLVEICAVFITLLNVGYRIYVVYLYSTQYVFDDCRFDIYKLVFVLLAFSSS
jgi:hypothetical protein